jgi:hypothetical protein
MRAEPAEAKSASPPPIQGERIKASPLAKRLAKQEGVDLLALKGSGPHGRIVKADVLNAPKGGAAKQAPAAGGGITSLIEPAILDDRIYAPDSYELIPLDGVRKVTARRLTQSFMQVPHFPLTIDLEIDHLLSARVRINEAGAAAGVKVLSSSHPAIQRLQVTVSATLLEALNVGASLSRRIVTAIVAFCTVPPSKSLRERVSVREGVGASELLAKMRCSITRSAIAGVEFAFKVTTKFPVVPPE